MGNSEQPQAPDSSQDSRRRLLEGTLGSQYEIVRLLGQGGNGVVYLARERLLERLVAIKVLRAEFVSVETRERFVREARTAARLMHAHIVPLYSFGEAGETLYYIMGFVEGESLESLLHRLGRLDHEESRRILVEVADALDYAHRNGVVHRDVKPDNILIDKQTRRVMLTDFGIAKHDATTSTLTHTGMIVGTPLYMSPEQASGDSSLDGRSDLYSLGVIGYRMLAGRLPVEGSSAQDVMRRHVTSDPEPLTRVAPDAPMDLSWAITRCLDKNPAMRWPTAEALRQALETGDESTGELPEQLELLSGLAWRIALVAWAAAMAGVVGWARTQTSGWLWLAIGAPAAAIVATLFGLLRAEGTGLTRARAWRLVGAPPERWTGWWPATLRRAGDIWERLPGSMSRSRSARTLAIAVLIGIGAPTFTAAIANSALMLAGPGRAFLLMVGGAALLAAAGHFYCRSLAHSALATAGVSKRVRMRWLDEPTWGSSFWRRPEAAAVFREPDKASTQLAIDSAAEDPYSITTPAQLEIPHGMFDHVDPRSPTPLYAQIASRLRVAIAAGELKPGDGLPSVRQLAGKLRINPATVVQAYRELEVEGLVSTRQGAGSVVMDVTADKRQKDRQHEARRLVRELLANAASLGIPAADLKTAIERELKGDSK
ncbi:MAG: protein kinase [Gemmatimonadota bacterium]